MCLVTALLIEPDQVTSLTIGERLTVSSRILGEDRDLLVALPPLYYKRSGSFPVLYLAADEAGFYQTATAAAFLAGLGHIPEMIVVAVGNTRNPRDLSPPADFGQTNDGVAERYLDFLEQEVFPLIEQRYCARPYRVFFGHGNGGLLAIHCFLQRTQLFQAYLAVSPPLFWNNSAYVKRLEQFLAQTPAPAASLVVAQGKASPRMMEPYLAFTRLLDQHKTQAFDNAHREFAEESRRSVLYPATYWGLQQLFDFWRVPAEIQTQGLIAHFNFFKHVSKRMGYSVAIPEATAIELGHRLIEKGDTDEALSVLGFNTALYPTSANALTSLAEAYEIAGEPSLALHYYLQALEVACQNDEPLGLFQSNVARSHTD